MMDDFIKVIMTADFSWLIDFARIMELYRKRNAGYGWDRKIKPATEK